MKYIIDIPNELAEASERYWEETTDMTLVPYTEPDRKAIEDEVWEFVRCVHKMNGDDYHECFGIDDVSDEDYCTKYSYQEAKEQCEAWKRKRDEELQIHVGDEVQYSLCGCECKFIVLGKENDTLYGIRSDCEDGLDDPYDGWDTCNKSERTLVKTGRHFDEVKKLLERMKAE